MFGFSFGELVVLVIVAVVVIGPKDLPKVLRKMGQWAGKLRRMAAELRAQSGIDDVLRSEGLAEDLNEIRKLARGELDTIARAARVDARPGPLLGGYTSDSSRGGPDPDLAMIDREREHPKDGPDAMNAIPDTAFMFDGGFPRSKWADDPVWVLGDPNGVVDKRPDGVESPPPSTSSAEKSGPADP